MKGNYELGAHAQSNNDQHLNLCICQTQKYPLFLLVSISTNEYIHTIWTYKFTSQINWPNADITNWFTCQRVLLLLDLFRPVENWVSLLRFVKLSLFPTRSGLLWTFRSLSLSLSPRANCNSLINRLHMYRMQTTHRRTATPMANRKVAILVSCESQDEGNIRALAKQSAYAWFIIGDDMCRY